MNLSSAQTRQAAEELDEALRGAYVNKVQEMEKNYLKIKLHSKQGAKELVIAPNAVYLTQYKLGVAERPKGFGQYLKKKLYNKRVEKVWQHSVDRIIVIEFRGAYLVCEIFGEGNVVLCDGDWKIMQPYRIEGWKDRKVRKGEQYVFPKNFSIEKIKKLGEKIREEGRESGLAEKLDESCSKILLESEVETKKEKRKKRLEHSRKEQEKARKKFWEKIAENKRKAELLYENYAEVSELLGAIREGQRKGFGEKEIEQKILGAKAQGTKGARLVKSINLRKKQAVLVLGE